MVLVGAGGTLVSIVRNYPDLLDDPMRTDAVHWSDRLMGAVRAAGGLDFDLMVNNHGRYSPSATLEMTRVRELYGLLFFEEPTTPDNILTLEKVSQGKSNVPLDILQPDIYHAGGILECHTIAMMAETAYFKVAPHNPNGPVAIAASVQPAAAIPNFLILEWALSEPHRTEVQRVGPRIEAGCINLPTAPRLGVELDPDVIAAHSYVVTDNREPFAVDGDVADI